MWLLIKKVVNAYIDLMDNCHLIDEAYMETNMDTENHRAEF